MGSLTDGSSHGFGGLARRATRQALAGGEGAPTIADLVGGVNRHLQGQRAVTPGMTPTPMSAYAPQPVAAPAAPMAAPAAPMPGAIGVGDIMRSIGQAQSTAGGGLGNAPGIADIIRQIRQLQGI